MRFAWVLVVLLTAPTAAAQDEPVPEATEVAPVEATDAATDAPAEPPVEAVPEPALEPTAEAPKVAVIVLGDPDDRLRGAARSVDDALEPTLRRPFDPGLRAALRGEPGEADDGLEEVRRDRRRLGGTEAADAPLLASLGRRAGALVVGVVRATPEGGAELVVLDVRQGAFYEGALALDGELAPGRVTSFLQRRARAAAHVESITPEAVAAQAPAEAEPAAPEEEDEPDFFEQYWPYMVAALLLAGMITAIIATQATEQTSVPVLRFVPGGG